MTLPDGVRRGWRLAVAVVSVVLLCTSAGRAQDVTESSLKAAFIYNFAKFTEWPADVLPATATFTACVLGDNATRDALDRIVKGRQLSGRTISVSEVQLGVGLRSCHLLYLSGVTPAQIAAIVAAVRGAPVLTISDIDDFARGGGIAQMFVENGKMRFDLNLDVAKELPAPAQLEAARACRARPRRTRGAGMVGETTPLMIKIRRGRVALVLVLLLAAAPRAAAQQPLPDLSLEELMSLDAGRVFGASERLQPVTEAPASVSFITAEEIARYGYRTLADILRGVRGMYVTNDRNFSFLGTRGFGKPGDYNSRILLLVNGHRVNDNVFGQAEIGAEFGIDPALFERVEIIRGPASSLYGDSAFFAVVNVITRVGRVARWRVAQRRGRHAGHAAGARQRGPAFRQRCRRGGGGNLRSRVPASISSISPRSTRRRRTTASPRGSTASASVSSTGS